MDGFAIGKHAGKFVNGGIVSIEGIFGALRVTGVRGKGGIEDLQVDAVSAGDFAEALFGIVQQFAQRVGDFEGTGPKIEVGRQVHDR